MIALAWGHYFAQLLPLLVCGYWWGAGRPAPPDARLLSAVLGLGFLADAVALHIAPESTHWIGYWLAPIQYGLLAMIVTEDHAVREIAVVGIAVLALVSWTRGTLDAPETVVRVTGGLVVGWLVWGNASLRRYRGPVLLLTVAAVPFLLALVLLPTRSAWWVRWWAGLMVLRTVGYGWLAWVIGRPVMEVVHGRPAQGGPFLGAEWPGVRPLGGGHREVVAPAKR